MSKMMSVQVKESPVRAQPFFLGKILATVYYGDRLEVVGADGPWIKISKPGTGILGWLHNSALTTKKIVLKAGSSDVQEAATNDELALAGKGFNRQVEDEFKSRNPNLDFAWIDRMERIVVSQEEMEQFLDDGLLSGKGGPR